MPINDLLPWNRSGSKLSTAKTREPEDDLAKMQSRMNLLFDDFFERPFGLSPFSRMGAGLGNFYPQIDVSETDEEIKVVAEVAGMDEKDIQVSLAEDVLTISGFKESEKEQKNRQYHRIERSSGSFRREIALPGSINENKVDATFKNGVLTVILPKLASESSKVKHINVQGK